MITRVLMIGILSVGSIAAIPTLCRADEDEEREKQEKRVNDVIVPFLKALQDKDIDAAMKYVDLPWLTHDEKIIKDRDELKKHLQERMKTIDQKLCAQKVSALGVWKFSVIRKAYKKQKKFVELADKVAQKNDLVVFTSGEETRYEGYFLIREQQGKLAIISGPHRKTYLLLDNNIPEIVEQMLTNYEQMELFSLDPDIHEGKPEEKLYGCKLLGKTAVKDPEQKKKLIAAFKQGVQNNFGTAYKCFEPRHLLRLKQKETTLDLVICFHCLKVEVLVNEKPLNNREILIDDSPQEVFDKILRDAGVKLAPKQNE